eukprot:m.211011 g.211011  ORF g.211011 m.211011 type:complete len:744 (+) comp10745_c0_seq1:1995-4226(+)
MAQPPKRYRSESATDDQGWSISRQMIEINERLCSEIERLQQRCAELEKVLASVEQPQSHETYMTQLLHARFIFSQWVQERYHNDLAPVYDYDVLLKALENLETLKQPSFRPYFDHCHQMVETGHDGRISHAHVKKSIVALMYTQIHQLPGRQPFAEDGSAYFRGLGLSLEGAQTLYHMGLSLSKSTCASHEKELTTDVFHLDLAEWIRRASERPNVQFTIVFDGFYSLRYANRPGSGPSAQPLSGTTVILVAHEVPSPLPNAAAIPERHSKPTLAEIAANAQRRCFGTFWAGESSFSLEDDKVLSSERLWARLKKIDKVRWNQLHESFCIRENTFLVDYFPQWRTEKSEDVAEMLAYLLEIPALKKLLETSPVLSPGDRWVFVPFMKLFYALQSWEVAVEQARRLPPPAHATRQAMAARGQQMVDHPNSGPIMRQPSLESLSTNQFFAKVPPTPGMYHFRRPGEMSYGNTLHSTKWEFQQRVATKLKRILQGLTASSENPVIKLRAGKGNRAEQITLPSLKPFGEVHVRNLAVPRRDTASQARGSRSRGRSSGQGRGRGRARVPNAAVVTPNDSHVRPDSESESSDVPAASATPCQDAPFDPAFALSPGFRASLHSGKFVPAAGRVALEFSCDKCNGRLLKTSDDWHVSTRCYWHRYHSKCEPSAETCELCLDTAKREIDEELVRLPEYYSATRLAQDDALEDAVPPANVHDDQIPPCEGEEEGLVDFSVLHIEELADISQSE